MTQPLCVAFIWHMHQPYYRDLRTGSCSMPWVRLHATKDYLDMLKRLEPFPTVHQTFNVVPSLLDQLREYLPPANQADTFLELSRKPAASLSLEDQRFILQWFFLANPERMIKPYPRYHDLLAKRGLHLSESEWTVVQRRFKMQDYLDLQVWFNLAWIDPWLRAQDPQLAKLEAKGSHFTEEEKDSVLTAHLHLIARIIPAYREAASRGQIELTTSPYYHPILPLLCDTKAAHAALPHLPLPETIFRHSEDARWQLQLGLRRHQEAFGVSARGVWPPEGSVSEEVVRLVIESGIQWIATDEEILWRSLKTSRAPSLLYRPHVLRRKGGQAAILFRDRELSDLIGFVYSQWNPKAAVADFIKRLGDIHGQFHSMDRPALVSIILDGENAWEFYPSDGHDFLMGLYQALADDARFRCVTPSEYLQQYPLEQEASLQDLFSGSWIDGNFATWVGHPEKNAAWALLTQARDALTAVNKEDPAYAQAWKSFGAAEGSDWMWWFGDTHFTAQAEEFDQLFRMHLANAYQLAKLEPPSVLKEPIRRQLVQLLHEPTGPIHPTIDGRESSYYEWLYAGRIDLKQQYSAIHRGNQYLQQLFYGADQAHLYLRFDVDQTLRACVEGWSFDLAFSHGVHVAIRPDERSGARADVIEPAAASLPCAFQRIIELAVPVQLFDLQPGEQLRLKITLLHQREVIEQHPAQGTFQLSPSVGDVAAQVWPV